MTLLMYSLRDQIEPVITKLLKDTWKLKSDEKVLILSDNPGPDDFALYPLELIQSMLKRNVFSSLVKDIIRDLNYGNVELHLFKPTYRHYEDPKDNKFEEYMKESDLVFSLTQYSLTDTPIIKKYLDQGKIRHCSAPMVEPEVFLPGGPIDINHHQIKNISSRLYSIINNAKRLEFIDPTNSLLKLKFDTNPQWIYEDGILDQPGMQANLPSGELTLELREERPEYHFGGQLNLFPGWYKDMTSMMILDICENEIINLEGGGYLGRELKELISTKRVRITQFGIGTNPNAKDPLSPTVADKCIGMAHITIYPQLQNQDTFYFPISKIIKDGRVYTRKEIFNVDQEIVLSK